MSLNCEKIELKNGIKNNDVKTVQTILKNLKLYDGKIDGQFGDITETSVKAYQKKKKLKQDGIIGPVTCKALQKETTEESTDTTLKKGSKGDNVKTLQQKLSDLGYYNGKVDSDYGTVTVNAVKTWQTYYNLKSDGVYGPLSQKVMNNTKTLKETSNSKKLGKALGVTIKDHGTLYQGAIKKGKYSYYNNDIYTYSQEINRVSNGSGINCTDWAQLGMSLLKEMGFNMDNLRIVRGVVTCKSGKSFGHVWLQLYLNGEWTNYDLSAAAAHGYSVQKLICVNGSYVTNINPGWAVSDDGIT